MQPGKVIRVPGSSALGCAVKDAHKSDAHKKNWTRFEIVLEGSNRFEEMIGIKKGVPRRAVTESHYCTFSVRAISTPGHVP